MKCTTCGCFLPSRPTYTEQVIVRDYDERGTPGEAGYAVHPVWVAQEREYRKCSHCLDEAVEVVE